MVGWPLVEVEFKVEDLALQQRKNLDVDFEYLGQVLEEEEGGREVVLVLDYVVDDQLHALHLVVLQSVVNRRPVKVLVVEVEQHRVGERDRLAFLGFLPVEDGVVASEIFIELVTKQELQ